MQLVAAAVSHGCKHCLCTFALHWLTQQCMLIPSISISLFFHFSKSCHSQVDPPWLTGASCYPTFLCCLIFALQVENSRVCMNVSHGDLCLQCLGQEECLVPQFPVQRRLINGTDAKQPDTNAKDSNYPLPIPLYQALVLLPRAFFPSTFFR